MTTKQAQVRKYQPVWERIKAREVVTLEVLPALVARVKKAVIKEKDMDLGFKVLNDHAKFRLIVDYSMEKKHLTFRLSSLNQRLGMEGVRR